MLQFDSFNWNNLFFIPFLLMKTRYNLDNMIKKIYLITLLVICSTAILFSQDRERRPREAKGIVYNKEYGGNLQLMTNGWSLGGHYGIMNTYYKTRTYSFEIGELKHPREERQSTGLGGGSFSNTSRSFIYGKQNNFYTIKVGMGEKRYFSEKADRKGVAVGMSYSFGPALGLIKPYYLEIQGSDPNTSIPSIRDVKYNGSEDSEFLKYPLIFGASSSLLGFNELSLAVGGQAKVGLHLDWGAYDEFLRALEIGVAVDVYSKNIPVMVTDANRPFFVNLYVKAILGKRE